VRQELSRQPDSTELPARESLAAGACHLGGDESPIESRVVRDEDVAADHAQNAIADVAEAGGILHHRPRDVGERGDHGRDRALRVDERLVDIPDLPIANDDRCNLGDPVASPGPPSRRLHVDDDIGQRRQHVGRGARNHARAVGPRRGLRGTAGSGDARRADRPCERINHAEARHPWRRRRWPSGCALHRDHGGALRIGHRRSRPDGTPRASSGLRVRGRAQRPQPTGLAHEFRATSEERCRHVLGHHPRRVRKLADVPDERDDIRRPGGQVVGGALGEAHLGRPRADPVGHEQLRRAAARARTSARRPPVTTTDRPA
jgi:hypothetical protein